MKPAQQGSIISQEQLAKLQKKPAKEEDTQPSAEAPPAAEEKTPEQVDAVAEFHRAKKANEDAIGTTISETDINDYIFRGRIVKRNVVAVKGKVTVSFQSLTPKELDAVDQAVAAIRAQGKHTEEGIRNLKTIEQLAYAWLEINGKPLPKDLEKKKESINQMGTYIVNRVVDSFRCFDVLIEMTLREEEFLKK